MIIPIVEGLFNKYRLLLPAVLFAGVVLIVFCVATDTNSWPTVLGILVAWYAIESQGNAIKKQIQLQAILEFDKEWSSPTMLTRRARVAWTLKDPPKNWEELNPKERSDIETVLEFFEKISSLVRDESLDLHVVWRATFGWHLMRYAHYSKDFVVYLRGSWTASPDVTLFEDLETVSGRLIDMEIKERSDFKTPISKSTIERDFNASKNRFLDSEKVL